MTRTVHVHRSRARNGLRAVAGIAIAASLVLAACGDDDDDGGTSTPASNAPTTAAATTIDAPASTSGSASTTGSQATTGSEPAGEDGLPASLAPKPLPQETTIKLGGPAFRNEAGLPQWLAEEMGEFEAENLKIEFVEAAAADVLFLLDQGAIDVTASGFTSGFFNLVNGGSVVRAVFAYGGAPESSKQGLWVRKDALGDDGVFQPEDLVGQEVLANTGASSASAAFFYTAMGLGPEDVTLTTLGLADMVPALSSGAAKFALLNTPFWLQLLDDPCCEFIPGTASLDSQGMYAFGKNLLDPKNQDVADAYVRAMARTVEKYLRTDYHENAEINQIVADILGLSLDELKQGPPSVWADDLVDGWYVNMQPNQKYFIDNGFVDYETPLSDDQLLDLSFVERAYGES